MRVLRGMRVVKYERVFASPLQPHTQPALGSQSPHFPTRGGTYTWFRSFCFCLLL